MGSVSDYQKRAKQCSERAQIVASGVDRARWRHLADQWAALSRIPFQRILMPHNPLAGFWRDERSLRSGIR